MIKNDHEEEKMIDKVSIYNDSNDYVKTRLDQSTRKPERYQSNL
jgi:hypothetical protein